MPLTRLTLEERIRCVRFYSMYDNASSIQKAWRKEFGTDPPSRKTIAALNKKFDETGSVADLSRSGRPKTSRTEATIALVQEALAKDPTKSIRSLSSELGVNKAAVHRIKQDSEKKKSTIRLENKKLKEKVVELQRRLAQLEARLNPREEINSAAETIPCAFDDSSKSTVIEHVDPGQITTIICTAGGMTTTGFINDGSHIATYPVQVVTQQQLEQLQNHAARIAQEQVTQVQLTMSDNLQIRTAEGQHLTCTTYPMFHIATPPS